MTKQKTRKSSKMQLPTLQELAKRYWIFVTMGSVSIIVITSKLFGKTSEGEVINVSSWLKTPYFACGISYVGYGQKFAVLRNAHIDVNTKTFSIPCVGEKPDYHFDEVGVKGNIMTVKNLMKGNILNSWMKNISVYEYSHIKRYKMSTIKSTTLVVNRIEAHNLYHAMCEWYGLFLISVLLHFDPKQVEILLMDDRPSNLLDETWSTLFGKVSRYDTLPTDNVFKTLVWNIFGYESPMNMAELGKLPYLTEFREFVLESFGIHQRKSLNCKRLRVTVILRRDYRSHPELTDGLVLRKFENNSNVLGIVEAIFEGHQVKGIYLEYYSMKEQLEIITNTDILVGMHGAGMSHTLFLHRHAGCFEMFPSYVEYYRFFKAFSRWRGILYTSWKNSDPTNEFPEYKTRIPTDVLVKHLTALKRRMCG